MLLKVAGVIFLLIGIGIIVGLWWVHQEKIMEDIAKDEADDYIEEEVNRRLMNAEIRVKQRLWLVYGKGMEHLK